MGGQISSFCQDSVKSSNWKDIFCFWEGALPVVSCRVLPPPPTRRGDKRTKRKSRALPRRVELWKHIFTTSGLALLEGQKPLKIRERYRAGWGLWNHIFITSGLALLEGQKPLKTKKKKKNSRALPRRVGALEAHFYHFGSCPPGRTKTPKDKKIASATAQGGGFGSTFLSLRVLPSWKDKDP